MAPEAIGTGTLRRLSALSTGGSATLSVYLDLETDSLCTPAGRDSQLRSLTTEPDLACARADIEQVRDLVAADAALTRAAQGLAIFSCAQAGILEALSLPCRVKPLVVLDTAAWLEPLVDMIAFGNRAVAVLGPVTARLLRGSSTTLAEFATLELLPRQHGCRSEPRSSSTGGLDRGVQSDAARIAEQLLRAHRRRALTDLVIVAREEARAPLDAALPAELRTVARGVINADLTCASTSELVHVVTPMLDGAQRARERAALICWENSLLTEGPATHGLAVAFAMLEHGRVAVLLIAEGARLTAGVCRRGGRVSIGQRSCRFDGTTLASIDAVAHAIDLAAAQSAEVMVIRHERDALIAHGGDRAPRPTTRGGQSDDLRAPDSPPATGIGYTVVRHPRSRAATAGKRRLTSPPRWRHHSPTNNKRKEQHLRPGALTRWASTTRARPT